jgi:hypothetical protein
MTHNPVRAAAPSRVTVDQISVNADNVKLASLLTDDGTQLLIPAALLPAGTAVGDVLLAQFSRDSDETAARARHSAELQRKLFG